MINRTRLVTSVILSCLVQSVSADQWPVWGGDQGGSRYSSLTQITADNVDDLELAWQIKTGHLEGRDENAANNAGFQVNPILLPIEAGEHLVLCTPFNDVLALNPVNGEQRWKYSPNYNLHGYGSAADPTGKDENPYYKCRGVAYWQDDQVEDGKFCKHRIVTATNELELIALDAATGKLCPDFGEGGIVNLQEQYLAKQPAFIGEVRFYNPPVVINDRLVLGTSVRDNHRWNAPSGAIRSFDARTGAFLWEFDPIPRDAADPEYKNWTADAAENTGGANAWGMMSADLERDIIFVPTSGPSPDFYGGTRPGDNRYSDSIVALNGETGEVIWHYQLIHHDVWDYDVGAQPVLVDLEKEGKPFPAVVQATKTGMIYIFHRETGEPFFAIEERPVPQGGVVGEVLSPTQPFPVKPPPLVKHGSSLEDLWGPVGFIQDKCVEKYKDAKFGPIFTPPSEQGTIVVPATAGGINWGSVAIDKQTNVLVTNVIDLAHYVKLIPNEKVKPKDAVEGDESIMSKAVPLHGTPYHLEQGPVMSPMYTPCSEPPFAKLVAVDLEKGSIKWEVALGTLDKLAPIPIPIKWGTPTFGGPIVTAGGVVFIGATADNRIRAFDINTGEELWKEELPTGAFAHPMTYTIDEEQYVVIASGGHPFVFRFPGDTVTAFKLPKNRSWLQKLF